MLDIVEWHDKNSADHLANVNKYAALNYRTIGLSMYGSVAHPMFAAVMVKRAVVIAETQRVGLDAAALAQAVKDMHAKQWSLLLLTAVGPKAKPVFTACFTAVSEQPQLQVGLSADAFREANADAAAAGNILVWADTYGDAAAGEVTYLGLWRTNADKRAWNCDGINDSDVDGQARFAALTGGYARPTVLARTAGAHPGTLVMYDDSFLASQWSVYTDMTAAAYQNKIDTLKPDQRPIRVSAKGEGGSARFAALFAGAEYTAKRAHRASDPKPFGMQPVQAIDVAITAVMDATMLHGASVAVVVGTRLVYARGYTFAEPGYPDIQPTTQFRQASVSKMFTAAAIYELIDDKVKLGNGSVFSTDTLLLDVLTDLSDKPASDNWKGIRIQHLLEMTSGINTSILGTDPLASANLSIGSNTMAKWLHQQPLTITPGDTTQGVYSNANYMLLGLVVAKLRNKGSLIEALQSTLLSRLQIQRVRAAKSLPKDQSVDEARYHARPLTTDNSVMVKGQPLCTTGYGEWNLEMTGGGGGLSAAATDVARLLASFSVTGVNPLMSTDTLDLWMKSAAHATQTITGPKDSKGVPTRAWGFHGFDAVSVTDAAKKTYWGYKGGDLSSSQNGIVFSMGGVSTVLCFNGLTPPPSPAWYPFYADLITAVNAHPWDATDLFPAFGMPSFTGKAIAAPVKWSGPLIPNNLPKHHFTPLGMKQTQV